MSESRLRFRDNPEALRALLGWCRFLADNDRGGRARLRRCEAPNQAAFVPCFYKLWADLQEAFGMERSRWSEIEREALEATAILVALLPEEATRSAKLPVLFGTPQKGTQEPRLHPLRFRQLLEAKNLGELFPGLRRALAVIEKPNRENAVTVSVGDLADSLFHWNESTRRRWAYDYYTAFSPKGAS